MNLIDWCSRQRRNCQLKTSTIQVSCPWSRRLMSSVSSTASTLGCIQTTDNHSSSLDLRAAEKGLWCYCTKLTDVHPVLGCFSNCPSHYREGMLCFFITRSHPAGDCKLIFSFLFYVLEPDCPSWSCISPCCNVCRCYQCQTFERCLQCTKLNTYHMLYC